MVLYDLVTEVAHVLNPPAALLWRACDGTTEVAALSAALAAATNAEVAQVHGDVANGLARLTEAGLLGRVTPVPDAPAVERSPVTGRIVSAVHQVLDDGVRFTSDDQALVDIVELLLGSLVADCEVTVVLGLTRDDDGTVGLSGWGPERRFGSESALLHALPTFLNDIAAKSGSCLALHAACVRSPSGEVLLLPAVSGSGKTTLTAALVQAGWAYASDEAVGVRADSLEAVAYPKPLVLDAGSRAVLGLVPAESPNVAPNELRADVRVVHRDVGVVTRVVLPRYEAGESAELEELTPRDAVVAVLEHALNLRRVGQPGLDALCQIAERVPVARLVHGGVADAVALLAD